MIYANMSDIVIVLDMSDVFAPETSCNLDIYWLKFDTRYMMSKTFIYILMWLLSSQYILSPVLMFLQDSSLGEVTGLQV